MNHYLKLISCGCLFALLVSCRTSQTLNQDDLKIFPTAQKGQQRFVIELPLERNEQLFKVELISGKTIMTDGVNKNSLGSVITPKILKGWGYKYYEVKGSDLMISTRMAPPPGSPQTKEFVKGKSLFIPYNSKVPIVIYAPKDHSVHYKVWSTTEAEIAAGPL